MTIGGGDGGNDNRGRLGSEPALELPPAEPSCRVTLDFQELPLAFADDDSSETDTSEADPETLAPLELPPEPPEDQRDSSALNLVGSRDSHLAIDLRSEMHERLALDDFTAALGLAELLLGRDDGDAEARAVAAECRKRLAQLYLSRLGNTGAVPRLAVPAGEIRWLGLDHRGGFLLSRVNGVATVEELCDVSGMERLEALKTLVELRDAGAITVE